MKLVLELGCGQGFNASILSRKARVVGVDISQPDLATAAGRYPRPAFLAMNAERLGFKNGVFDVIQVRDVLEHIDNLPAALGEIRRCLKPGGEIVAEVPYWKSERRLTRLRPSYPREIHHVRVFGEDELEKTMAGYNFRLTGKKRRGFLSHLEFLVGFRSKEKSRTQLGIGNWRDNWRSFLLHLGLLYFNPLVLKTPLRYFPIWLITLPLGMTADFLGNIIFPKSLSYRFLLPAPAGGEEAERQKKAAGGEPAGIME